MLEMRSIDVEAKDGAIGFTCLLIAAQYGHLAVCRLLLDKGALLEAKDGGGRTPLHRAACGGNVEVVRLLCDRGADVEARDRWRDRPLHDAAAYGHISITKELIEERNAEINAIANGERTALWFARKYRKHDVAAYLVLHGAIDVDDEEEDEGNDDDEADGDDNNIDNDHEDRDD